MYIEIVIYMQRVIIKQCFICTPPSSCPWAQYEVHAGNGVWNKAKLPGCKGEDTTQCRYTIKATFTADVGTDVRASPQGS